VLEPTAGLRQNGVRILNQIPKEQEDQVQGPLKDTYKKLMFLTTFYHAVLQERKSYNALGWNNTYDFAFADHQLSNFVGITTFREIVSDERRTAAKKLPLLHYVISSIIYGGKVSNLQDQSILEEILKTYINKKLTDGSADYNLSGLAKIPDSLVHYSMPSGYINKDGLSNHFERFPPEDRPAIFGIHPNCQMSVLRDQGTKLLDYIHKF